MSKATEALVRSYVRSYPGEIAGKLESLPAGQGAQLIEKQPIIDAVEIVDHLTPDMAARVIELLPNESAAALSQVRLYADWLVGI